MQKTETDPGPNGSGRRKRSSDAPESPRIRVEDRRHWAREDRDDDDDAAPATTVPTVVDEYRRRTEEAESRLREYIAAFKQAEADQEAFRARLQADVERRVELRFGELVSEWLDAIDDLDVALEHVAAVPEAEALARGVALVRDRFLAALRKSGVEPVTPDGDPFDPNVAEAVRVDAVDDDERDGKVTETMRPGYRLGDRVIRPARVAVGKRTN